MIIGQSAGGKQRALLWIPFSSDAHGFRLAQTLW